MFFRPVVRTGLRDVDYRLRGDAAREAAAAFKSGMTDLDARWRHSEFARSTDLAASLQY